MKIDVMFSKNTDNWATPTTLYKKFMESGYYDPCPLNPTEDGLKTEWKEKNFVNPPYSKLKEWIEKSILEHSKGKEVILLIPSRTDTKAFKRLYDYGSHFRFITGRLKFNDKGSAPFPSVIIIITGARSTFEFVERSTVLL